MTDTYIQDRYRNKKIKCSTSRECKLSIIEALYVLTYKSSLAFKQPLGLHIRIRFTTKMNLSKFSSRLTTHYKRKYNYQPLRISAKENDPQDDGTHYHLAVILEGKKSTIRGMYQFLTALVNSGYMTDFSVIAPRKNKFGQQMKSELDRDEYFEWLSYIAKIETKNTSRQCFSVCKSTQQDLTSWHRNNKPDLGEDYAHSINRQKSHSEALKHLLDCDPLGVYSNPIQTPSNRSAGAYTPYIH